MKAIGRQSDYLLVDRFENDPGNQFHGGPFASTELGVSPMEKMKIIHKRKGE